MPTWTFLAVGLGAGVLSGLFGIGGGVVIVPALILLVPLTAMQFTAEVAWGVGDFIFAWTLMAGVGLAYKFVTSQTANLAYRAGMARGAGGFSEK